MPAVPANILNYRREQCARCKTPCDFKLKDEYLSEGENGCPSNRFIQYQTHKMGGYRGAGDLVASVAQPIAGVLDKILGTKIKGCKSCRERQEMLNYMVPFNINK
jgi:hypothetical protein